MDTTAVSGAGAGRPNRRSDFGAGRLFLADSRLAFGIVNYARYQALNRVFGVQREQANLFTFILVLSAAPPMVAGLWGAVRKPLAMATGVNAGVGAFAVREATRGIAGPGASEVPHVEALLALAAVGGLAIPQLRRALLGVRAAEHRVRQQRERMYRTARVAMRPAQALLRAHATGDSAAFHAAAEQLAEERARKGHWLREDEQERSARLLLHDERRRLRLRT